MLFSLPVTLEERADWYLFRDTIDQYGNASWASGVNSEDKPLELGDDGLGHFMRNAAVFVLVLGAVALYIRARSKAGSGYSKHG